MLRVINVNWQNGFVDFIEVMSRAANLDAELAAYGNISHL
jgi:hypothetical protein